MNNQDIKKLREKGIFNNLDIHFAKLMTCLSNRKSSELFLAAALVSSYKRQGHICIDLSAMGGTHLPDEVSDISCPEADKWVLELRKCTAVGEPGEFKPMILDNKSRLYMHRYHEYQHKLVDSIKLRINEDINDINLLKLKKEIEQMFPVPSIKEAQDWQKVAAFTAITKRFCVITGGPGTGKTTTVVKIIALLLALADHIKPRIALTAPTGKAAARLKEAIKNVGEELNIPKIIADAIPVEVSTIHRLLGYIPDSPYFRHHAENQLPVDVVIVDEASMVDMALMSKLVQALAPQTQLILLGDEDQLASVEAGAVLGDICDTGNTHDFSVEFADNLKKMTGCELEIRKNKGTESGICDSIIRLEKSYRFGENSGISLLSRAINSGDGRLALELAKSSKHTNVRWQQLPGHKGLASGIKDMVINGFGDYLRAKKHSDIFKWFERFRILCALRKGPFGSVAVNQLVEMILKEERLIDPEKVWYSGRPILMKGNDYRLQLFNGDIGVTLPDPESDNDLRVFFQGMDGNLRKFHPLRVAEHETAYAMTVHKSQGSEFDKVLLVLSDRESPVLTRELLYTGITRARDVVEIWGNEDIFHTAVHNCTERMSGLRDALWE